MKPREILVSEVSGESFETTGEVTLSNRPHGSTMAFTHDARFMYVVCNPAQSKGAELYEIDLQYPNRIARLLQLPAWKFQGIAVHCPSSKIFLSDPVSRVIWVVNRNYFTIQWRISIEDGTPGALVMSPAGDVLYVLSSDGDSLWVIDPCSNMVMGRLKGLRSGTSTTEWLSDGSRLFVSCAAKGDGAVVRVLPKRASGRQARQVFTVDHNGNCRITRGSKPTSLAVA